MVQMAQETQTASAPATPPPASGGGSLNGNSDVMDFLLGPEEPQEQGEGSESGEDAAPESGDSPAEGEEGNDGAEAAAASNDGDLTALAAKKGLDPKNPAHVKLLKEIQALEKRVNDGQAHIKTLQKAADTLTEFERQLAEEEAAETEPQSAAAKQADKSEPKQAEARDRTAPPAGYNDIGKSWNSPADAVVAYAEAWGKYRGDDPKASREGLNEIVAIENAAFERRLDAHLGPVYDRIQQWVESRFSQFREKDLGFLPAVQKNLEAQRRNDANAFARAQLKATPFGSVLAEMDKPSAEGATFEFDGEVFPDTPFNRILSENPDILSIEVKHKDPDKAEKLTRIAQYKGAVRAYMASKGSRAPETAKELVKAGAKIQEKKQEQATRQGMNGGSPSGGRKTATGDEFLDGLISRGSSSSGMSVDSLLRR